MRVRVWFKRFAIGAVVVLAIAASVVAVLNYRAGRRLDATLAALREAGEPTTPTDLAPLPVPPNDDAGAALAAVAADTAALNRELAELASDKSIEVLRNGALTEVGAERVRELFGRRPNLEAQLIAAATLPGYRPQCDIEAEMSTVINKVSDSMRSPARVLNYRSSLHMFDGDRGAAVRDGIAVMRFGRHFEREPCLTLYLTSLAVRSIAVEMLQRALADGPATRELHAELEAELARHDGMEGFELALRSERVFGLIQFERSIPGPARWLWIFMNDEADYLDLMGAHLRLGAQPVYLVSEDIKALNGRVKSFGMLTQVVAPAIAATRNGMDRTRAAIRCLRLANAWQTKALAGDVVEPVLEALDLPGDVKLDPFDGQPLRTKKTDGGWVFYSVDHNRKDDDGQIENTKVASLDVGVGPFRLSAEPKERE